MKRSILTLFFSLALVAASSSLSGSQSALAQTAPPPPPGPRDPGVRPGPSGAGGPIAGLQPIQMSYFTSALSRFLEVASVSGTIPGESGVGLGPRFNGNSCSGCHAFPAVGGSSPPTNPQIGMATLDGAQNTVPNFLTPNGPVREARFLTNPDGSADGGVHALFVITGRSDARGCQIQQPNFAAVQAANNIAFRIPTPLFGLGLVEATSDANLLATFAANSLLRASLGIAGHFNTSPNDGTISRFGWKAQNKSLLLFAGEAYNVEEGVTNELFPNERDNNPGCQFNQLPEDNTNLTNDINSGSPASDLSSDIVNFAAFSRLTAAPAPAPTTPQTTAGFQVFQTIGCQACHASTQTSGPSSFAGLNQQTYAPFSDFALHNMGQGLADGISQGSAGPQEFRTAPLWGVGQRLFFLHDGRTSDLPTAIDQHASAGSEANVVVRNWRTLAPQDRQNLIAFLRSL